MAEGLAAAEKLLAENTCRPGTPEETLPEGSPPADSLSQASTADAIPSRSGSDAPYVGTMKSFNTQNGYGFILCEATKAKFGRDVFVTLQDFQAAGSPLAGAAVSFSTHLNHNGHPQASSLTVTAGTGMGMNASSSSEAPETRKRAMRKQVEWYFSDANLSTDEFFYNKISKAMPDGWVAVYWLLRCAKIRELDATPESILEALRDSHLDTKLTCTCGQPLCQDLTQHLYVRRRQPLPPFVGKEHKTTNGTVANVPDSAAVDKYKTMNRLKDQRVVQETLGLKEVGDPTTVFREIIGNHVLGPVIANGYERVVYGDHGAYIEFTAEQVNWDAWPHFHDKSTFGHLRCYDEYFTAYSFPIWSSRWDEAKNNIRYGEAPRANTDGLLMLYAQTQGVDHKPWAPNTWGQSRWKSGYADYRARHFYMTANCKLVGVEGRKPEQFKEGLAADPAVLSVSSMAPLASGQQEQASVCWQWQQGKCWKGNACKWLHGDSQEWKLHGDSCAMVTRRLHGWSANAGWN